jgi:hypothetical protein
MENHFLIAGLGLTLSLTPALAASTLGQNDLTYVFAGREVKGEYSNGVAFSEIYHKNGTITYAEGATRVAGKWKISETSFCTEYDGLTGGCFNVKSTGANCFEYWLLDAAGKVKDPNWIARGWQAKYPSTCPSK